MPVHEKEETDNHEVGAATEQVMKNPSSKTEGGSDHPLHQPDPPKGDKVQLRDAEAGKTGPVIPDDFSAQQEGTKEERKAKAQELNK